MYQRVEGNTWQHIWLTGDLHGCFALLMSALKARQFNPYKDLLISVGDLIDRGPDSLKCLELLEEKWVLAIRGNHEQMAMDALTHQQLSLWELNGGEWFERCSPSERAAARRLLQACEALPFIIEVVTDAATHVIAHADYPAAHYRWQQTVDWHRVLWDRQRLSDHLAGQHHPIDGADHFWFGHTPLRHRYDVLNQHYIDTGAVFGGKLTLVQLQ
ncbi:protein-serine/threonine phosphatase [Enterobacter asburiae]|uniref:protein-serine/threonine phosphatase n=1 Tax=Scandinavium sp. UTDF21-P1B TaxID=3446379 RepID=UPI003494F2DA